MGEVTHDDLMALLEHYAHWLGHQLPLASSISVHGLATKTMFDLMEGILARGGNQASVTAKIDTLDTTLTCKPTGLRAFPSSALSGEPLAVTVQVVWLEEGALGCDIGPDLYLLLRVLCLYGGWLTLTPRLRDVDEALPATIWRVWDWKARLLVGEEVSEDSVPELPEDLRWKEGR